MSEQSRARAEDALRQHMENQPVRADWLTEAALNHCCVECDRHWPCPTVLLARDVLAALERERALEQENKRLGEGWDSEVGIAREAATQREEAWLAHEKEWTKTGVKLRERMQSAEAERDALRQELQQLREKLK